MTVPLRLLALSLALVVAPLALAQEPVPVPEPSEEALRYYRSGNVWWVVSVVWGLLVPAVILVTGLSARIRNWARAIGRRWLFVVAAYLAIFMGIVFLIDLPLEYLHGYVRPHAYGLSNQSFGKWLGNELKGLAVAVVVGGLVLWIPYLFLRRSPRRWWLYTGLAAVPLVFLMAMVGPIWISPLFNEFGPMKDPALEARILALADRAGIEGGRVFEVNKSVDTEAVNAYVTGFLGTKRIVLWDTLLEKLEDDEVLFVMGHEMGHYVLGHVVMGIGLSSAGVLVVLLLVHGTARPLVGRLGGLFGFDDLADVASLPLLVVLANAFLLGGLPIAAAVSRAMEHQADRFGLEITQDNRAAALAFVKLQRENLGNPRPGLLYRLRSSHPSLGDRIDFCNTYRPWAEGKPREYGSRLDEAGAGVLTDRG